MKVRARVKAREYWPEWACCCHVDHLTKQEFVADPAITRGPIPGRCKLCGAEQPALLDVVTYIDGEEYWMCIELLDLDEGPMEAK